MKLTRRKGRVSARRQRQRTTPPFFMGGTAETVGVPEMDADTDAPTGFVGGALNDLQDKVRTFLSEEIEYYPTQLQKTEDEKKEFKDHVIGELEKDTNPKYKVLTDLLKAQAGGATTRRQASTQGLGEDLQKGIIKQELFDTLKELLGKLNEIAFKKLKVKKIGDYAEDEVLKNVLEQELTVLLTVSLDAPHIITTDMDILYKNDAADLLKKLLEQIFIKSQSADTPIELNSVEERLANIADAFAGIICFYRNKDASFDLDKCPEIGKTIDLITSKPSTNYDYNPNGSIESAAAFDKAMQATDSKHNAIIDDISGLLWTKYIQTLQRKLMKNSSNSLSAAAAAAAATDTAINTGAGTGLDLSRIPQRLLPPVLGISSPTGNGAQTPSA